MEPVTVSTASVDQSGQGLNILILAKRFPSCIQTWLLNWIEQTLTHGAEVTIVSDGADVENLPRKIYELDLLKNTYHFPAGSNWEILTGLLAYFPWKRKRPIHPWQSFFQFAATKPRLSIIGWCRAAVRSQIFSVGEFNLAHSHSFISSYEYLPILQAGQIPLVTSYHGPTPPGVPFLKNRQLTDVFDYTSLFLVNTHFALEQLKALGCPEEKIQILPQGTQLNDFPFKPKALSENQKLIVLTVGRFQKDKGHRYAIEAISLLLNKGMDVEYRMVGIGPEKDTLLKLAADLGIGNRVSAYGPLVDDALKKEFHDADIFLLPSLENEEGMTVETQGVVLQEAQASGCLVVASRTGGIPEVIDDDISGWLVDCRDARGIADKITWLAENKDKWEDWRKQARLWVEKHFNTNLLGEKLIKLYKQVAIGNG